MDEIELTALIEFIRTEYGDFKPRSRELQQTLMAFGIDDAIALGSLILGAWPYLFPRGHTPKCPHKLYFAGRVCGLPLSSIVYNEATKELVMHCCNGHTTIQRTTRFYAKV